MRTRAIPTIGLALILAACAAAQGDPSASDAAGGSAPPDSPGATMSAAPSLPPLDPEQSVQAELDGATLHDVSYASAGGGRVSGWMVVPEGSGPFAAIVYLHGSETDRDDFVDEAIAMASGDAVTLTIDAPFAREGESRTGSLGNYFDPDGEAALTQQTLDDLGRAVDLLVARPDVDPDRIGFVGHSWGASLGAVFAARDGRFAANVLITGRPSWTGFLRRSEDAFAGEISVLGEDGWDAYLAAMEPFDAVPAVGEADGQALYLQFGTADDVVLADDIDRWLAEAPDGTKVDRYPAGHALDADAVADRATWLAERLGLEPIAQERLDTVGLPDEASPIP